MRIRAAAARLAIRAKRESTPPLHKCIQTEEDTLKQMAEHIPMSKHITPRIADGTRNDGGKPPPLADRKRKQARNRAALSTKERYARARKLADKQVRMLGRSRFVP